MARAWSKARWLGAPDYHPKWYRPALVVWHPRWEYATAKDGRVYQRWGRTTTGTQVDKRGRVSQCEYIEIWVLESTPDQDYRSLTVEVLAHEYLHLIWLRRMHIDPEFKLAQASSWLDAGEAWVRELLGQENGPKHMH